MEPMCDLALAYVLVFLFILFDRIRPTCTEVAGYYHPIADSPE